MAGAGGQEQAMGGGFVKQIGTMVLWMVIPGIVINLITWLKNGCGKKKLNKHEHAMSRKNIVIGLGILYVAYQAWVMVDTSEPNYYETLNVGIYATRSEIKRAYKKMSLENHPDKGGSQEDFIRIQTAHEVLKDKETRRVYNLFGPDGVECSLKPHCNSDTDLFLYTRFPTMIGYYIVALIITVIATLGRNRAPIRTWCFLALLGMIALELFISFSEANPFEEFFQFWKPIYQMLELLRTFYFLAFTGACIVCSNYGGDYRTEREIILQMEERQAVVLNQLSSLIFNNMLSMDDKRVERMAALMPEALALKIAQRRETTTKALKKLQEADPNALGKENLTMAQRVIQYYRVRAVQVMTHQQILKGAGLKAMEPKKMK